MEPRLQLFDFADLDQAAYCRLQQRAFAEIFARHAIPIARLDTRFFTWKYAPPAGRGRIAVMFHGEEMVASNAMFPLDLATGMHRSRGWQSCDTGTSPAARGKGYFKACIGALRDSLARGERFFGYPNAHSRRGCEAIGWGVLSEIPVRVRPVWRDAHVGAEIVAVDEFGAGQDAFARELEQHEPTMIERSAAYMNWRYVRHPLYDYARHHCVHEGRVTGCLVTNAMTVNGRRHVIVMEFLVVDERATRPLLSQAIHSARTAGASTILSIGNRAIPTSIRVPGFLLPKRQVLMGQEIGPPNTPLDEPWLVQAGDWDVF